MKRPPAIQKEQKRKRVKGCLEVIFLLIILWVFGVWSSSKFGPSDHETAQKQKEIEKAFNDYKYFIETSGLNRYISSITVKGNGKDVELIVKNTWHYSHKQVRLQTAQTLWEVWAARFCLEKKQLDYCRLTLKDLKGNVVGGSSSLAGSVIKVPD